MKRCIATLLTAAMVLSLAGCNKDDNNETRTSRESHTTTTEDTDTTESDYTEPTETESSTTETSESEESTTESETTASETETSETKDTDATSSESETSASSDTTPSETSSGDPDKLPAFSHDLKQVKLTPQKSDRAYAEPYSYETSSILRLREHLESCLPADQTHDKLIEKMEEIFTDVKLRNDKLYDKAISAFPDMAKNTTDDNYWENCFQSIQSYVHVARSDSKILSFSISEYVGLNDQETNTFSYYNFDPNTGEPILLSDIVTDEQAFIEAILSYRFDPDSSGYSESQEDYNNALQMLCDNLRNGTDKDVPFLVYQNTILVEVVAPSAGEPTSFSCTLPALKLGNCVDLSYFTSTPEYYSLRDDSDGKFYWDFDEDGSVDEIEVMNVSSNYDLELRITYNGKEMDVADSVHYADLPDDVVWCIIAHTDSGYYLYVEVSEENPVDSTLIYKIENGKITFVAATGEFDSYPYDPEEAVIMYRSDLLGTGSSSHACTLIGSNGSPRDTSAFFDKSAIAVVTQDMIVGKFDSNGTPTGETVNVPKGTAVQFFGVDMSTCVAYFTTLHLDESENEEFQMMATKYDHDYDYEITFDGVSSYKLFMGPGYAD